MRNEIPMEVMYDMFKVLTPKQFELHILTQENKTLKLNSKCKILKLGAEFDSQKESRLEGLTLKRGNVIGF